MGWPVDENLVEIRLVGVPAAEAPALGCPTTDDPDQAMAWARGRLAAT